MSLTWEQKAEAMDALAPFTFKIVPRHGGGGWCASVSAEVKSGPILSSGNGHGKSVETAVLALWQGLVTDLKAEDYLVINAMGPNRRAVRWNGFMWADVFEDRP